MIATSEDTSESTPDTASDSAASDSAASDSAASDSAASDFGASDAAMPGTSTLDTLRAGMAACIVSIGTSDATIRLMEMGIVPGATINVVRRAPLGDPIDVFIQGYHLSLRAAEARLVCVRVTTPGSSA